MLSFGRAGFRWFEPWTLALWLGGGILILGFHYLPGQDVPNHVAMTHLGAQLLRGDVDLAALYESAWLRPTHRLHFAVAVPLALVLGAHLATSITVFLLWSGFVAACRALVAASRVPDWVVLLIAPWFFGTQFFLGFLPSLTGLVMALWGVWAFLRAHQTGRSRYQLAAVSFGVATFFAHSFMVGAWGAALLAFVLLDWRNRWRRGVVACAVTIGVPLTVWLAGRLERTDTNTGQFLGGLEFSLQEHIDWIPRVGWETFVEPWALYGRMGLVVLGLLLLVVWLYFKLRRRELVESHGAGRFFAVLVGCLLLAYFVAPVSGQRAWGLAPRLLAPLWIAVVLLGGHALQQISARWRRALTFAAIAVVCVHGVGLGLVFSQANAGLRAIEPVCRALRHGSHLEVSRVRHASYGVSLYLDYHAPGYCLTEGLRTSDNLFTDVHMLVHLRPGITKPPADYLLVDERRNPEPQRRGTQVLRSGDWVLNALSSSSAFAPAASDAPTQSPPENPTEPLSG